MGGRKTEMKILVTGAKGFIGQNLIAELRYRADTEIYEYDRGTCRELLDEYCRKCDFVFNLAGINRPKNPSEFMEGNCDFALELVGKLKSYHNMCPVMLSSSIQAEQNNAYGESKRAGEIVLKKYSEETGSKVYIYRFPNLFGKWSRPNYNSVIATFCHNIAHGLPIHVNDPSVNIRLVYIDDVVHSLVGLLNGQADINENGFCYVPHIYEITLGEAAELIQSFRDSRLKRSIPDMTEGGLTKKLYSTYLSYLPQNQFSYPLKMNTDERGSFTEIIRTEDRGQLAVNITKPGIEKGNHWHHTKNEKFVVVSGKGLIQLRRPGTDEIISYHVSGEAIEVVDIPVGYTHNIINEGETDLVTFMWCNECFNPEKPDTYFLKVKEDK